MREEVRVCIYNGLIETCVLDIIIYSVHCNFAMASLFGVVRGADLDFLLVVGNGELDLNEVIASRWRFSVRPYI